MAVKEHPQDQLIVKNIDIGCEDVTSELVRKDRTRRDENGHNYIAYEEVLEEYNHAEFFQVKFDGHAFKIKVGEERLMPRYVAEHFAKHLANHILQKREIKEDRTGYSNHPVERPKVLKQILTGVQSYFYDEDDNLEMDLGAKAYREVEAINKPRGVDLGTIEDRDPVPNKALGKLDTAPPPESLEEILNRVEDEPATEEATPNTPKLNQPDSLSKHELIIAAQSQGIKVTGKETKQELASKVRASA